MTIQLSLIAPLAAGTSSRNVKRHVKREWHILLDDAVLVVGVLLAGAEVVGVHTPVAFDRARSGDNLEAKGKLSMRCCSGLEERAHTGP